MKKHLCALALLSMLSLQAENITKIETSDNNGLLGQSFVKVGIGTIHFEDKEMRDMFGNNYALGLFASHKATENISLGLSITTLQADIDYNGVTGEASNLVLSASALYHFFPKKMIDPYLSLSLIKGSSKIDLEYQGDTYSESDSGHAYTVSVGSEVDLSNTIFLTPSASYSKRDDVKEGDSSSRDIAVKLDYKLTEKIYIGGGISTELDDDKDIFYYVGISGKF